MRSAELPRPDLEPAGAASAAAAAAAAGLANAANAANSAHATGSASTVAAPRTVRSASRRGRQRGARRGALLAAPGNDSQWRTLRALGYARVLLAAALVISLAVFGAPPLVRTGADATRAATALIIDAAIYLGLALLCAAAAISLRRQFKVQVAGQLCVDLVLITILTALSGGVGRGMVILYLLPLAAASLLLSTVATFFVCSIVVLALLIDTTLRSLAGEPIELFQAGLYGAALFAITGLLRLMAIRLAQQEDLALARGRNFDNQLEINRLVIAQMAQGVLVVDAAARVHANNRATRRLLRLGDDYRLTGRRLDEVPASQGLAQAFVAWLARGRDAGSWPDSTMLLRGQAPSDLVYDLPALQARARFVRPAAANAEEFVIFLEDTRVLEDRAQRLKLAAMGRLTASIAHEIRNPLAAISHAGQLLAEDAREPVQKRLAAIVRENTARLNRLVDDVLRVARREPPLGDEFDLVEFLPGWLAEFVRDRELDPDRIVVQRIASARIKFEQGHLRQILYNLADNALRYASGQPGSVTLMVEEQHAPEERLLLWVFDDGPGVATDTRAALFEPFFTTHARGTGLGLYLAREFCIANRADLVYDTWGSGATQRPGFAIRFSRDALSREREPDFLDTMPAR